VAYLGKVVVLIDGGYLSKVLENDFQKVKINFLKLSDNVCGDSERLRTYYDSVSGKAHDFSRGMRANHS